MGITERFIENVLTPLLVALCIYKLPIASLPLRITVGLLTLGLLVIFTAIIIKDDKRYVNEFSLVMLIIVFLATIFTLLWVIIKFPIAVIQVSIERIVLHVKKHDKG